MCLKVARLITFLLVLLMSLDIVGASVDVLPPTSDGTVSIHSPNPSTSLLGNLFFQKVDEESEKAEEETGGERLVLVDFSQIAFSLSLYHSPQVEPAVPTFQYDVRPPLHQFNCLFLI